MAIIDRRGATVSATDAPSSSTPNPDLAIKTAVRVATTGNIILNGLQTIDGVALAAGDRVLVKNQTDQTTNGIHNASTGNWAMSPDFQNNSQVTVGLQVLVTSGTLNAQTTWSLTGANPIVLGTSAITFLAPAAFIVGSSKINVGKSTSTQYGVLFNKNGVLGDANSDTSLTNGIVGPMLTISSNPAPLVNIATIVSGGVPATLALGTADEGETVLSLQAFGTNSNSTISLLKARGTAANPLPLLNGDVIGLIGASGWSAAGRANGAPGSGFVEFRATENFSATNNGTGISFFVQTNGTAYPTGAIGVMQINAGGAGGVTIGGTQADFFTPLAHDFGTGTLSMTGGLFINKNTAALLSGTGSGSAVTHTAQANGAENISLLDSFANDSGLLFRRANGTAAALAALAANDLIGIVGALGYGSTVYGGGSANISFYAAQAWTDANQGAYIDLITAANNTIIRSTRLRVENDGGITIPNTVTGGSKGSGTINVAGNLYVNGLGPERLTLTATAVNFNSANTDAPQLTVTLPSGVTNYQIVNVRIANPSASISTATWGLFSAAAGGGTAIFAGGQAVTVTTAAANTNNNSMVAAPANAGTQSFNFASLFFRVGTAQGSAATADVIITIAPMY